MRMDPVAKAAILSAELAALTEHHRLACPPYARAIDALAPWRIEADVPWLPVRMFKQHRLVSVPDDEVFTVLTSSGTTGAAVSRIHLDRTSAGRQQRALTRTLGALLGPNRLPMLVADIPSIVRSGSARGAGVLGMMNLGRRPVFALDETYSLDEPAVRAFLEAHGSEAFLVFGFTFMAWQHLLAPAAAAGLDLSNGILVHSGGWKKLVDQAVDDTTFRAAFAERVGLRRVHNFYGMVEQIGTVFLQGADGPLRPPDFADVVIRDPRTWRPVPDGEPGVVHVLSVLPTSYPGHSLATEDLGVIVTREPSPEGWTGAGIRILGRIPAAEARGCSDTFEARR